ncbi:MAG: hypothetical protein JNM70_20860, partial [Anaerolineae bacterium]|nr:hypothetical protein [Anaerolineae bacterium]
DELARLLEAQTAATNGDTAGAAASIAEVQAQLGVLLAACEQAEGLLSETLEFPDGLFRIQYPASWSEVRPLGLAYVLGNEAVVVDRVAQGELTETMPPGSQAVVVAYTNTQDLFGVDGFEAAHQELLNTGLLDEISFTNPQSLSINGFSGYQYDLHARGMAYAFDLGVNDRMALFIALAAPGEYPAMEPLLKAVMASMDYGAQESAPVTPAENLILNAGLPLSQITYTQAQSLDELSDTLNLSVLIDPRFAMLAPDGSRMAWFARDTGESDGICLLNFSDGGVQCTSTGDQFRNGPSQLLWSLDSRYIALTQEWTMTFNDPDLWVLDTTNQRLTNLTDDGFDRIPLGGDAPEGGTTGPLWIEAAYTWGPDGYLYFVREETPDITQRDIRNTALYRLSPEGGEPERIRDLSGLWTRLAIYEFAERDLNGAMAVSPDAGQIAFLVRESDRDSASNGVWVMSLSGADAPRQIITMSDLRIGLPSDMDDRDAGLLPMGLAWTADQTGLFVYASNAAQLTGIAAMLYHYRLTDGTLTALSDFSSYTEAQLTQVNPETGFTPLFETPRTAALSPDGTAVLTIQRDFLAENVGLITLWAYTLGAEGVERSQIYETNENFSLAQSTSVAADGQAILLGVLFSPG